MRITAESRHALARAKFFLDKARACSQDARVDFEAYLEATIVFARAAVHRLETRYRKRQGWKPVWESWAREPSIEFFRRQRDWILKQAPPAIGQKVFAATIGSNTPAFAASSAGEFYYYEDPQIPATTTVEAHLVSLEGLLTAAERKFGP